MGKKNKSLPIIPSTFVPEKRRTGMAKITDFLDDFFKPHVHALKRASEVRRIMATLFSLEDRPYHVIGYGSLLNPRSAKKSLQDVVTFKPAVLSGYKRVFNIATKYSGAVLNVEPDPDSDINVNIATITPEDMSNLILREWQYDLVTVDRSLLSTINGVGSIELDSDPVMVVGREDRIMTDVTHQEPGLDYIQTCIHGTGKVAPKMVDLFLDSSFLRDGITTIREWLAQVDLVKVYVEKDSKY